MWKLCRALSWQGSQGAVHTRGAVCGCREGSAVAELLGNGRLSQLHCQPLRGKDGEGKRWDHTCRSIAIGYSCRCLHKFASRKISQDQLCRSRRQGWLELTNNYCHTINIFCWARGRAAVCTLWHTSPGH